jgi:curved DNA-binding protein CbpA
MDDVMKIEAEKQELFIDYYEILDLRSDATNDEIKAAFRGLAKITHPDPDGNAITDGAEAFKQVNAAYHVLKDPVKRQSFDRERDEYKAKDAEVMRLRREERWQKYRTLFKKIRFILWRSGTLAIVLGLFKIGSRDISGAVSILILSLMLLALAGIITYLTLYKNTYNFLDTLLRK